MGSEMCIRDSVQAVRLVDLEGFTPMFTVREMHRTRSTSYSAGVIYTYVGSGVTSPTDCLSSGPESFSIASGRRGSLTMHIAQKYELARALSGTRESLPPDFDDRITYLNSNHMPLVAVNAGRFKCAFTRTGIFEELEAADPAFVRNLVIVGQKTSFAHRIFPFPASTELFPNWYSLAAPTIPREHALATRAIMDSIDPFSPAARIGGYTMATPLDLQPVRTVLRELGYLEVPVGLASVPISTIIVPTVFVGALLVAALGVAVYLGVRYARARRAAAKTEVRLQDALETGAMADYARSFLELLSRFEIEAALRLVPPLRRCSKATFALLLVLERLAGNLRVYKPFLPHALVAAAAAGGQVADDDDSDAPAEPDAVRASNDGVVVHASAVDLVDRASAVDRALARRDAAAPSHASDIAVARAPRGVCAASPTPAQIRDSHGRSTVRRSPEPQMQEQPLPQVDAAVLALPPRVALFDDAALNHDLYLWWAALACVLPIHQPWACLLYTSPSPRDRTRSRMPSSA